ncbi:MAG TPA: hypothetical protein VFV03_05125, partial [Solirubrobacteraceae bacterium]|nr:hypothetical protein [Solirubrobacteraceae bacterium]
LMAFNSTLAVKAAPIVACVLMACGCAQIASAQGGARDSSTTTGPGGPGYSVALEQCITSTVQAERSATFTAQMVATGTTHRMGMRIELQQRLRGEATFHTILAPGFGIWRGSEAGVKIYKYVKQVTNLAAPAAYRVVVRFRWLGERGHVLKRAELRTPRCLQPILSAQVKQTPAPTPIA